MFHGSWVTRRTNFRHPCELCLETCGTTSSSWRTGSKNSRKQVQRSVQYSDTAQRLMTVPGIGRLAASALEASAGNGHQFANGRFFAAWLGLTPREYSTGGKTTLLGISKRGNTYLRRKLIHGARSCVQTCDRQRHPLGAWITKLEQRMHRNKVIVALANKIARVAWKILTRPEEIYRWADA